MQSRTSLCLTTIAALAASLFTALASAADAPRSAMQEAGRPLYISPMISAVASDSKRGSQGGMGAALGVGTRLFDFLAVEASAFVSRHKPDDVAFTGSDRHAVGYGGSLLLFPFDGKLANAYAVAGVHYTRNSDAPATTGTTPTLIDYDGIAYDAGIGVLGPFNLFSAPAAFRLEARYRAETFDEHRAGSGDEDLFNDVVLNLGLLVPILWKEAPPPTATAEPAQVVAVADVDSDGVIDDADQCPDSAVGTAVESTGCPAAAPTETSTGAAAPAADAAPADVPAEPAAPDAAP